MLPKPDASAIREMTIGDEGADALFSQTFDQTMAYERLARPGNAGKQRKTLILFDSMHQLGNRGFVGRRGVIERRVGRYRERPAL